MCLKPRWLMEVRVRRRGIEGVLRREGCYTYPLPGTRRCYTPLRPAREGCCRCPHPVWEGPWDWSRYLQDQKVTISKKNIFKKRLFVHIFFCLRSCKTPKENNTPAQVCCALESKSVSRAENLPLCNMCSAHKNHYRGQYLCLVQIE